MTKNPPANSVCVLGCGRSGTSIFGELFESLPYYRYYSEPHWSEFKSIPFTTPVAVKVPRPPGQSVTTPGLPFNLNDFLEIFPKSGTIFWQVRHPLDTVCSLRVGISKNWGHHPRPPDYLQWGHRSLLEQCAYHWNYINTVGYQHVKALAIVNKFEDMIANPEELALARLRQAGVEITGSLPEIKLWAQRVQNENNKYFIEAVCSRPYSRNDHTRKVGRWRENLSKQQIAQIIPIISQGAESFGYDLDVF